MGLFTFGKKKKCDTEKKVSAIPAVANSSATPDPLDEVYKALKNNAYEQLIDIIQSPSVNTYNALYAIGKSMKGGTSVTTTGYVGASNLVKNIHVESLPDVENIELEKILFHFAVNDSEQGNRYIAASGIKNHELLYQLALLSPGFDDVGRDIILNKRMLTDVAELEHIALSAKFHGIRHFAVFVLNDQAALERIARNESTDTVTRIYAYKKLTDSTSEQN